MGPVGDHAGLARPAETPAEAGAPVVMRLFQLRGYLTMLVSSCMTAWLTEIVRVESW